MGKDWTKEIPEGLEMLEGTLPPNPKGKHIFGTVTMNEKFLFTKITTELPNTGVDGF